MLVTLPERGDTMYPGECSGTSRMNDGRKGTCAFSSLATLPFQVFLSPNKADSSTHSKP